MTSRRRASLRLMWLVLIALSTLSCHASAPEVAIGMTVHPRGADTETIKRQFDLMADMNVAWVRIDIDWSVIESEQSRLDWVSTDSLVGTVLAHVQPPKSGL